MVIARLRRQSRLVFATWVMMMVIEGCLILLYSYNMGSQKYIETYLYWTRFTVDFEHTLFEHHVVAGMMSFLFWYVFMALHYGVMMVVWFIQLAISESFVHTMAGYKSQVDIDGKLNISGIRSSRCQFQQLREHADKAFYLIIFTNFATLYIETGLRLAFEKQSNGKYTRRGSPYRGNTVLC